jgi:hypothetical protein
MIHKLLLLLGLALIPLGSWAQSSLPTCPEKGVKERCFGTLVNGLGAVYVGEILDSKPHGYGILYSKFGQVAQAGDWREGIIRRSVELEISQYPFHFESPKDARRDRYARVDGQAPKRDDSLPACGLTSSFESCFGRLVNGIGAVYVGEVSKGKAQGVGILYSRLGDVVLSGRWNQGSLVHPLRLSESQFPFNDSPKIASVTPDLGNAERDRLAAEIEVERKKRQELEERLAAAEAKERERQQAQAPQPQRPQAVLRNERRLALIIGNSSYKISPLDNPANDATDVAESLKKFGFQTTLVRNATLGQMREATRRFADQLPSADVALIYFAGHGIEANRKNYMIPVNADLKFEYELADQGYDAGIWLEMLESIKSNNADRVNIVILDACRNNSLIGSRNLGRGLGKMDAPSGTFLAYSTAPGKVAADGGRGERNSPFTKHLLRAMQQPNQPIEEVFKEVRRNVGKETNGAQVPWESTSLTGFFTFRQSR